MNDCSKITALYSRLSVGNKDRDGGESNRIQNQKKFLESYVRQLKLTNIRHYIDDDESGRFFDRSAYSRMMRQLKARISKLQNWLKEKTTDRSGANPAYGGERLS